MGRGTRKRRRGGAISRERRRNQPQSTTHATSHTLCANRTQSHGTKQTQRERDTSPGTSHGCVLSRVRHVLWCRHANGSANVTSQSRTYSSCRTSRLAAQGWAAARSCRCVMSEREGSACVGSCMQFVLSLSDGRGIGLSV